MSEEAPEERMVALHSLAAEYSQKLDLTNPVLSRSALSTARDGWWFDLTLVSAEDADDDDGPAWWFSLIRREDGVDAVQSEATLGNEERLLFELFSSVTHELARQGLDAIEGSDFRPQMFADQHRLLAAINPGWAALKAEQHRRLLAQSPAQDVADVD
ncbi:hypothetical protein [Brevundimonas sp.]|uniref:hypothetical protein n=1 Tax=Brevundimonas sp. TaxID=1871086 RepID=UPI002D54C214|nr:hypothetical protein [Brevundimonas sp.]HYD26296.1 hypothetical protein [Brevundimonas sp.]